MKTESHPLDRFLEASFKLFYSLFAALFLLIKKDGPENLQERRHRSSSEQTGPHITAFVMWCAAWIMLILAIDFDSNLPEIVSNGMQFAGLSSRKTDIIPVGAALSILSVLIFEYILRNQNNTILNVIEDYSTESQQKWLDIGLYIWAQVAVKYFWFFFACIILTKLLKRAGIQSKSILSFIVLFCLLIWQWISLMRVGKFFFANQKKHCDELKNWPPQARIRRAQKLAAWNLLLLILARKTKKWLHSTGKLQQRQARPDIFELRSLAKSPLGTKSIPFLRAALIRAPRLLRRRLLRISSRSMEMQASGMFTYGVGCVFCILLFVLILFVFIFNNLTIELEANYVLCQQTSDGSMMVEAAITNNTPFPRFLETRSFAAVFTDTAVRQRSPAAPMLLPLEVRQPETTPRTTYKLIEPASRSQLIFRGAADRVLLAQFDDALRQTGAAYACGLKLVQKPLAEGTTTKATLLPPTRRSLVVYPERSPFRAQAGE